jgi:hypothetical protein
MGSLPEPRGTISELLVAELTRDVHTVPPISVSSPPDVLADEDLQLALYLCYELHYRGLPGVVAEWEWEPSLLALRGTLERQIDRGLVELAGQPGPTAAPEDMDLALREIAEADQGPSLSVFAERHASLEQMLEFMVHRSAYQLKEADPHSFALPRLWGRPKAALVEIQADEYGGGRVDRIHAELFARAMRAVGLEPEYGAYLDRVPALSLATVNLMSRWGLHRRWRGALVGQLALFEMTSSIPNRRYAAGLRRLGFGQDATAFFDEHVMADAVHENIAAVDLAGGLVAQEPELGADVLWGARAFGALEGRWSRHLLSRWESGETSLREPLAVGVG